MSEPTAGPRCGNNPNVQRTPGDEKVIEEFRAYLAARAALRDRIAEALEQADYSGKMRRGDLADTVLPALYEDLPRLRATSLPPPRRNLEAEALAEVRRLCDMTIAASIRTDAIHQARDTLAAIDRVMATEAQPQTQGAPS